MAMTCAWMRRLWPLVACVCLLCISICPARAGGSSGTDVSGISLLVATGNQDIDLAERYALQVIAENFNGVTHAASADYYGNPWIRDSFAWGMIPSQRDPSISAYFTSEIRYWLARQQPFGGWLTAPKSGYFDETAILISGVLDAYRVGGSLALVRQALPKLERGWHWLAHGFIKPKKGSKVLLYANVPPHVAADWVDQVARTGYATQLEALWYGATRSMGTMEALVGHPGRAHYYTRFAAGIKRDINRLLWTTSAPYAFKAPPVPAFGHYRSWRGPHDYFELDSNYLCILYGIASQKQADSIDDFVERHAGYLLGLNAANGVPARVLYGDYAPADYAWKRNRIGVGIYQSASWPSVGALVALGLRRTGRIDEARTLLVRLSETFIAQQDIREWYSSAGSGEGAPHFQWAARMFIIAVFDVYRGVNVDSIRTTEPLSVGMLKFTRAMTKKRTLRSE
ncbi:MAG TPA: hypothetical protein VHB98_07885 [Chloroflexota bacterium]|jgi:hypothetical protein|nr:hypothetical protein [Chloroflexota bacterium]